MQDIDKLFKKSQVLMENSKKLSSSDSLKTIDKLRRIKVNITNQSVNDQYKELVDTELKLMDNNIKDVSSTLLSISRLSRVSTQLPIVMIHFLSCKGNLIK